MPQLLKTKAYQVGHIEGIEHNHFCVGYGDNRGFHRFGICTAYTPYYTERVTVGSTVGSIAHVYQQLKAK